MKEKQRKADVSIKQLRSLRSDDQNGDLTNAHAYGDSLRISMFSSSGRNVQLHTLMSSQNVNTAQGSSAPTKTASLFGKIYNLNAGL